jgi:heme A synthase
MHMFGPPRRPEFDQYSIKLTVGVIALVLPWLEIFLTHGSVTSISEAFWSDNGPWPRTIFVGLLFAISSLMLAYNGEDELEMWLGKLGSFFAVGIAMFPCGCSDAATEIIPHVHVTCAGALFAVMGVFCVIFLRRARRKGHREALRRVAIYAACCAGTVIALGLIIGYALTKIAVLVLYAETAGLTSFGVSWLTASRMLPFITSPAERNKLFVST